MLLGVFLHVSDSIADNWLPRDRLIQLLDFGTSIKAFVYTCYEVQSWPLLPLLNRVGHHSLTGCLAFTNGFLVSGNVDCSVRMWDIESGVCRHLCCGHTSGVTSVEENQGALLRYRGASHVYIMILQCGRRWNDQVLVNYNGEMYRHN